MTNNNKKEPPKTALEYYTRGERYFEEGNYNAAFDDYNKAIYLDENFAEAWSSRGATRNEKGEYDQALEDLNKAIRLKPDYAEAWNNRGVTWNHKGKHDQAISDLNESIRLDPNYAIAWNNRGIAWSAKGEHNLAIADYDEAILQNPNCAEAWSNRGVAWDAKGEHDMALIDHNEAIRRKPDSASIWSNRGTCWARKGEYGKAITDYEKALLLDPENKDASRNREAVLAVQSTATERHTIAENLSREYSNLLKKELQDTVERISADTKDFRKEEKENMDLSRTLRRRAVCLLVGISSGLFLVFALIYIFEIYIPEKELNLTTFLSWTPAVVAISSPLFLLWWMLQRWSYESKTLAYGFQRKAIVEDRLFRYAAVNEKFFQEMLKLYLTHWMEKSPLEVMLAIGGKNKGMSRNDSPATILLGKVVDSVDVVAKKGASDTSSQT